jgi:hypothetical protein
MHHELIEQHNTYCRLDVGLFKESTFTNAFSCTSMNFVHQNDFL